MIDAVLISPYRWFSASAPVWAWWWGTAVLSVWCVLLGELTMALANHINRRYVDESNREMIRAGRLSLKALRGGDKRAYKGMNKLANEAFGRSFFLNMAMGCSSLWPAFLALAWLQKRFSGYDIPVPVFGLLVGYAAGFIACYVACRLVWAWLKPRALGRLKGLLPS